MIMMQKTHDKADAVPLTTDASNHCAPGIYYCRQLLCRTGARQETLLPESEIVRRRYDSLDFYLDLVHMDVAVRMPDGSMCRPDRNLVGIKGQPLCVLRKLMRRRGIFSTPHEIGTLPPYHDSHFINDNIVQYVARLRRNLFREDKDRERFLFTLRDPYRVAFNGELSFCLIEPATELTGQTI